MRRSLIAVTVLILGWPAAARADENPHLARARGELDELKYDRAARSLEQALATGTNGPAELAEIYRLSGEVAAALGDAKVAEEHFRRLLAIKPDARLAAGVSPKISQPFEAARAWFSSRTPIQVRHELSADEPRSITVLVDSDPLNMIAAARANVVVDGGAAERIERKGPAPIELTLPEEGRLEVEVAAVDRYGNRVVEISTPSRPIVVPAPRRVEDAGGGGGGDGDDDDRDRRTAPSRSIFGRWYVWGGLALGFAAAGTWFGFQALDAEEELARLNMNSSMHDFTEALEVENRGRRHALVANINFGVAGALGLVATYLIVKDLGSSDAPRRDTARVIPSADPNGVGVTIVAPF